MRRKHDEGWKGIKERTGGGEVEGGGRSGVGEEGGRVRGRGEGIKRAAYCFTSSTRLCVHCTVYLCVSSRVMSF